MKALGHFKGIQAPQRSAPAQLSGAAARAGRLPCLRNVASSARQHSSAAPGCDDADAAASALAWPSTDGVDIARMAKAMAMAAVVSTVALGVQPARAEDRVWKPRRHNRRMGEYISDTWADEVVAVSPMHVAAATVACMGRMHGLLSLWRVVGRT